MPDKQFTPEGLSPGKATVEKALTPEELASFFFPNVTLRVDYTDAPDDVVRKVNAALAQLGAAFVDDGESHDGFMVFTLQPTG